MSPKAINLYRNVSFLLVLVFTCIFVFPVILQSNNENELDSLWQLLNTEAVDAIEKIDILNHISKKYLTKDLDSAMTYAQRADALSRASSYQKGLVISLLRQGQVFDSQENFDGALKFYKNVIEMYQALEKDEDYLTALNLIGIIYEYRHDYDKALEYYQSGRKEAAIQGNKKYMAFFYNNMSFVYRYTGDLDLELENFKTASSLFKELGEDKFYSYTLVNIGSHYRGVKEYDSAIDYFKRAEILLSRDSNYYGLTNLYLNLAEIDVDKHDLTEAISYFNKSLHHAKLIDSLSPDRNNRISIVHLRLGTTYLLMKNYSSAKEHFLKAREIGKTYNALLNDEELSYGLFKSYLMRNQRDSALYYLDLYQAYSDSLREERYNEVIDSLNYDFKLEKERELLTFEKKRQELIYMSVAGLLFFLVCLIVFIWYLQKLKLQKTELAKENLRLENENITTNLEKKNRELTTNMMYLLKKNEFIATLSEKLKEIGPDSDPKTKRVISNMIREMESSQKKDAWEEFEVRFNDVHVDFYNSLNKKHPGLSPNELRLSAFLRLNMSSKEISSITFQSFQSIKVARYRLRKKLGLNQGDNLISYLNQF